MSACIGQDEGPGIKRVKLNERGESKSPCWVTDLWKLTEEELSMIQRLYHDNDVPFIIRDLRNSEIAETDW